MQGNGLLRNLTLVFMASSTWKQVIYYNKHIANTVRRKRNQTMKFGLVINYNLTNKCSKIKNKAGRLVPELLLFFLKKLYMR